jgi:hypothetical protein
MATAAKCLKRGALTTTLTTNQYTCGTTNGAIITNIVISNTNTTTARAVTVSIGPSGGPFVLLPKISVPFNSVVTFDLKQFIANTEVITAGQDVGTDVNIHISGVEL